MKPVILKCPSCSGELECSADQDIIECTYCGSSVKIREALLLKLEGNIENYLDIAFQSVKARNFDEAILYSNKVLELDSKNVKAWWVKAAACINSSNGDATKMREGLAYSVQARKFANEDERNEIKEIVIRDLVTHDLWPSHIDFLFEVFEAYDANDTRVLSKIIDITFSDSDSCSSNYDLESADLYEKRIKALLLLEKINPAEYETKIQNVKEQEEEITLDRKEYLDKFMKESIENLLKRFLGTGVVSAILFMIIMYFVTGYMSSIFALITLLLGFGLFYIFIYIAARDLTMKHEKEKFGTDYIQ